MSTGDPAAAGSGAAATAEDAAEPGVGAAAAVAALLFAHRVGDALEDLALRLAAGRLTEVGLDHVEERGERVLGQTGVLFVMYFVTGRSLHISDIRWCLYLTLCNAEIRRSIPATLPLAT
jgi:hypothetical protein